MGLQGGGVIGGLVVLTGIGGEGGKGGGGGGGGGEGGACVCGIGGGGEVDKVDFEGLVVKGLSVVGFLVGKPAKP